MSKRTNIEQLMDLSEIFDGNNENSQAHSYKGMQSMEGFPVPPHMNSSYNEQMSREILDREKAKSSYQGKIRQSVDHRLAMNAGMADGSNFYPIVPNIHRKNVEEEHFEYKKLMVEEDEEEYEMGPRARRNMDRNRDREMNREINREMNKHHFPSHISCIDIARHIKSCPICSKLYENDKSIYIIGIVFLLVICIILLKKIIESGDK